MKKSKSESRVAKRWQSFMDWAAKHWKVLAVCALVLAVGVFVTICWLNIGKWSIWFDESFGALLIKFNFLDIAKYTSQDVHPPLYYWILKCWAAIFGHTDIALRAMSVLFGAGTIVFGFLLTKKTFGRKAAFVVLPLLALSPMLIRYGIEARMYTMAAFIVVAATYVLVLANSKKSRGLWILYGVLVAAGMWTHYFTAFVWVAHWAWRLINQYKLGWRGKELARKYFNKDWVTAYGVAIILYLPWLPFMIWQLRTVQGSGFWIPPVGADTLTNYATETLFYQEHNVLSSWLTVLLYVFVALLVFLAVRTYRKINKKEKSSFRLLLLTAFLPPILLFVASLPPMRSSFVDRYLLPSIITTVLLIGVVVAVKTTGWTRKLRPVLFIVTLFMFVIGVGNVIHFGNYNKTTKTISMAKTLMSDINGKTDNETPVITDTPWVFYDALVYDSPKNPVYFLDSSTDYYYGSLKMLKENDESVRKIKNVEDFIKPGDEVWYISSTGQAKNPPVGNWKLIDSFSVTDPITGQSQTEAAKYIAQ